MKTITKYLDCRHAAALIVALGLASASAQNYGVITSLVSFNGTNGTSPSGPLVLGPDNGLYGETMSGGTNLPGSAGFGTAFKVATDGTLTSLASFPLDLVNAFVDGFSPVGGLVAGSDGSFYGVAQFGGANQYGVLFNLTASGSLSPLITFNGTNGIYPQGGLVQDTNGYLYGMTQVGGASFGSALGLGHGTVFKTSTNGVIVWSFSFNGTNGESPVGLTLASDGNFYGTTSAGGTNSSGTVFSITPGGTLTVLYSFSGSDDGGSPQAGLIQSTDGSLYGTTQSGGTNSAGTVFKITTNGEFATVYTFGQVLDSTGMKVLDGSDPMAALAQGRDGNFYGTTSRGGTNGFGTIFSLTAAGALTRLYSFGQIKDASGHALDGATPTAALAQASDGHFYGTTSAGGTNDVASGGDGTIYRLNNLGNFAPFIALQPTNQTVLTAATVTFAVTAGGTPPLKYQWQFGGTNLTDNARISGSQSNQLAIAGVVAADFGGYQVIVTNSYGSVTSAVATLAQAVPPGIFQQPVSITVDPGSDAIFSVQAYGTPPLSYQWLKNGTNLSDIGNVFGSATPTLTLTSISDQDAGTYGVTVSSPFGSTNSVQATLTVAQLPDLLVTGLVAPAEAWTGGSFDVAWADTNQGRVSAVGPWIDDLYLSPDNQTQHAIQFLGSFQFNGSLGPGQSIKRVETVTLDQTGITNGLYHVLVVVNATQSVFEGPGASNDVGVSAPVQVHVTPLPELKVTSVTAPTNGLGGALIDVSWTECNVGAEATAAPLWYDNLYLSPTTNKADAIVDYGRFVNPSYLAPGDCYDQSATVTLPVGAGGPYYFIVEADSTSQVVQQDASGHLGWTASPIDVQLVQPGFLHVASVQVAPAPPTTTWAGEQVTVTWTVRNTGQSAVTGTWDDGVSLSPTSTYDYTNGYWNLINHVYFQGPLQPGDSYTHTDQFTVPQGIKSGTWYAVPIADTHFYAGGNGLIGSGYIGRDQNSTPLEVVSVPPADLEVTSVTAPTQAVASQPISVQWSVANNGLNPTFSGFWYDGVYLSASAAFDVSKSTLVGTLNHIGDLDLGASYTQQGTLIVPQNVLQTNETVVTNYLFVLADVDGKVAEIPNGTHYLAAPNPVIIRRAAADLAVTSVVAPGTVVAGRQAIISWTVSNLGTAPTDATNWQDAVYLSATAALDLSQAVLLGYVSRDGGLAAGDSYTQSQTLNLPSCAVGSFYVLVDADSGHQVIEGTNLANNVGASPSTMRVMPSTAARLQVSSVSAPASAVAGGTLTVSWSVVNAGSATGQAAWMDGVYLSTSPQFDPINADLIGSYTYAGSLASGASYSQTQTFPVPACLAGPYFAFVVADVSNVINSISCETNNWGRSSSSVEVAPSPYPRLQVTGMSIPLQADSGAPWTIQWTVTNSGSAMATGTWFDAVYASTLPGLDTNAMLLGRFNHMNGLAAAQSYAQSQQVSLPACTSGQFYIFVLADIDHQVDEPSCRINNQARSANPLQLNFGFYPDLQVVALQFPSTAYNGNSMTVSWSVTNAGPGVAAAPWADGIYLSPVGTIFPTNSVFLGAKLHSASLVGGAAYSEAQDFALPAGLTGRFNVVVVTDNSNTVQECQGETNNTLVGPGEVRIFPGTYPDLAVPEVMAPATAFSGEDVAVTWVVANNGTAPTGGTGWFDALYLSRDQVLDPADIKLGAFPNLQALAVGQSYTNSVMAHISPFAAGPYYIIVVADSEGDLANGINERNNTGLSPAAVVVNRPAPVDLLATNVTISPATALPGQPVTISWTVQNSIANATADTWTDALYLATNNAWQITAMLLTNVDHTGLAASGAYAASWTGPLPALTPGTYYAIVRTDVRNTLLESNLANNTAASLNTISVDVPVLSLGQTVTNQLTTGAAQYYKVNCAAGLTVGVSLTGASPNSANELYARYGAVPDLGNYDFIYDNPLGPDQAIVIPATQAGWYYLMVRGGNEPGGPLAYALTASIIPFAISGVVPSQVGDNGQITISLNGAKFEQGATVQLVSGTNLFSAETNIFIDTTSLQARFMFTNAAHGTYDIVLTNPNRQSTTATQALVIEAAIPLAAKVIPGVVNPTPRAGTSVQWFGRVVNVGNVDIPYLTVATLVDLPYTIDLTPPPASILAVTNSGQTAAGDCLFLARNLAPGASLDFHFGITGFGSQGFYYEVRPTVQSKQDFLGQVAYMAESLRQYALTNLGVMTFTTTNTVGVVTTNTGTLPPAAQAALPDATLWEQFFAQSLVTAGLLDPGDLMALPQPMSVFLAPGQRARPGKEGIFECDTQCFLIYGVGCNTAVFAATLACLAGSIPTTFGFGAPLCIAFELAGLVACLAQEDKCLDGCPKPPPPPCSAPASVAGLAPVCPRVPKDPNEKQGPAGYSSAAFAGVQQPWLYTIYFENETNAAAYARQVQITDTLDPNLDLRSFRLSEIAFGDVTVTVPANRAFYQTRVALPAPNPTNIVADLSAGVDLEKGQVFWTMNAIDLNTGELVDNPQAGILPPNNTNHVGEGHVVYSIKPKAGVSTGTVVTNRAIIVFDANEPIGTGTTTNTVDGVAPISSVAALPPVVVETNFTVSWSGTDEVGGSGVANYDIYVSDNAGPWQLWQADLTQNSAVFNGQPGHSYAFYSLARDNAGNVESAPASFEATILVSANHPPTLAAHTNQTVAVGATLILTNAAADSDLPTERLTFSLQDAPAGASIDPATGIVTWSPVPTQAGTTNLFTVTVTDNGIPPLVTSQSFLVLVPDYVALSLGSVAVQAGQPGSMPLDLFSSASLTNFSFTLRMPTNQISNVHFVAVDPAISNVTVQFPDTGHPFVAVGTGPGLAFKGALEAVDIQFDVPAGESSGIVPLLIQTPAAQQANGTSISNIVVSAGQIIIVGEQPILKASDLGQKRVGLTIYGTPGLTFDFETSTNLAGPWSIAATLPLTNTVQSITWTNQSERARFFRLRKN